LLEVDVFALYVRLLISRFGTTENRSLSLSLSPLNKATTKHHDKKGTLGSSSTPTAGQSIEDIPRNVTDVQVVIDPSVKGIGNRASFSGCTQLKSVGG